MALDTLKVGSNDRNIYLLGDPNAAANLRSVLTLADARALAGLYAALTQNVGILLNSAGSFDQQRSAIGTLGIPAISSESTKATYSSSVIGFTPVATATDFFTLVGSGTKTVRLLKLTITGFATVAISIPIQLIKRTTADTTGTAAAQTIAVHDSNDAAPTAVVNTYSVNPGGLGTNGGVVEAENLNMGVTGAAGRMVWDFSTRNSKAPVLRGIAQAFALNWNGAAVPGGTTLTIKVEFSEE